MTNPKYQINPKNSKSKHYKLAIGVSGSGTTFEAIAKAIENSELPMEIVFLFADRECFAMERAKKFDIRTVMRKPDEKRADFHRRVIGELKKEKVDLVALCGYLQFFPVTKNDPYIVLNSHPGAIPEFGGSGMYGQKVHEAVIQFTKATNYRHPYTYSTIRIASAEYDKGPIVGLKQLEIKKNDTAESLAKRLLPLEHQNYIEVLQKFSEGKIEYLRNSSGLVLSGEKQLLQSIKVKVTEL